MVDRPADPPVDVRIVREPSAPGVPTQTFALYLLKNGIITGELPTVSGGFVDDFLTTFSIDCVLAPVSRRTFTQNNVTGGAFFLELVILGIKNRIRVIRSLAWQIGFASTGTPDKASVRIEAVETDGPKNHFELDQPFVASGKVIGDGRSSLSSLFRQILPLALLPGDKLIFRQDVSVVTPLGNEVTIYDELWQVPFRPAGT